MKSCKGCGKELVGKEKLFCKNCWSKAKEKSKNVVSWGLGIAGFVLLAISQKDKIASIFNDDSTDS